MLHRLRVPARPVLAAIALLLAGAVPAAALQPIPGIQAPIRDQVKTDVPVCQNLRDVRRTLRGQGFTYVEYVRTEGVVMIFIASHRDYPASARFQLDYDSCAKRMLRVQRLS